MNESPYQTCGNSTVWEGCEGVRVCVNGRGVRGCVCEGCEGCVCEGVCMCVGGKGVSVCVCVCVCVSMCKCELPLPLLTSPSSSM